MKKDKIIMLFGMILTRCLSLFAIFFSFTRIYCQLLPIVKNAGKPDLTSSTHTNFHDLTTCLDSPACWVDQSQCND